MNIAIIFLFIFLIGIVLVSSILIIKRRKRKISTITTVQDLLDSKYFMPQDVVYVNKHLTLALNKTYTKIAVVENFSPNSRTFFKYREINVSSITKLEKTNSIKLYYYSNGILETLLINSNKAEIKDFVHDLFEASCFKKIQTKFPNYKFDNISSSDFECSYVWAHSKEGNIFVYFKTFDTKAIRKIELNKILYTIDTRYKYFEIPLFSIPQQLFIYNNTFLNDVFDSLFKEIKDKCNCISKNSIYYDSYNNIVYISNGFSSLQSILLDKISEVYYKDNKISFALKGSDRIINFLADEDLINNFEDFLINYNLKKIANNFNHKTDKLINTTEYTKFIIDYTRNRIIYCANLNKISSFNYLIIAIDNLYDIKVEKYGSRCFLRIITRENKIIDVTCNKIEIAQYIEALIKSNA